MAVAIAGVSLLPACGGEDLSTMELQMTQPAAENLAQTSNELSVSGTTFDLPPHGGTTGVPTSTDCPSGYVAVGIHGHSGSHIDRLGLLCRYLNTNDNSLGITYRAGAQGGFGGALFEIKCPDGEAVVGFQGRSSDYVHQLKLYCSSPSYWYSSGMVQHGSGPTGSYSLGYEFNETCPQPYVVTSLNVRVGNLVDRIQTVCSQLIQ
jgi:hypothetical protein